MGDASELDRETARRPCDGVGETARSPRSLCQLRSDSCSGLPEADVTDLRSASCLAGMTRATDCAR